MAKSRAERARGRGETKSKRSMRGARQVGRQDQERGVTSRARKRKQGGETVPDPRFGGRPGQEKTKWRSPQERTSPRQKRATARSASRGGTSSSRTTSPRTGRH